MRNWPLTTLLAGLWLLVTIANAGILWLSLRGRSASFVAGLAGASGAFALWMAPSLGRLFSCLWQV